MNPDLSYEALLARNRELEQQVTAFRDLTATLKESEARWHRLSEYLPVVFYTSRPDETPSNFFISGRMEKITGYPAGQFMRDPTLFAHIIHPEDRMRVMSEIDTALHTEGPINTEYRIITVKGETRWIRDRATPIYEHDRLVRMEGIMEDITDVKNMEEERLRTMAQLRQAQKMEAIGTLAGGIAHDFNNILSAILGYSELALDESEGNRSSDKYIRQIIKAGYRARDLVQQILTFSRQTESMARPIQLRPIIKEALKLLRASLPSTIEIKSDVESEAIVHADPTQIHQVIMNLCTNAGHAMRQKGGVLDVSLKEELLDESFTQQHPGMVPGIHIRLKVSDTGHGIDPSIMDKIFDPYFTTKEKEEGTGMGLAMVQGIVQSCKGAVTVHSTKNRGTLFDIYLPIIHGKTEYESKLDAVVPGGNERILFVDDEPSLTNLGKQVLERLGYHVVTCNSSAEALSLFMRDPHAFDLVVTDMTMPLMTGDEMAAKMLTVRPGLPIVICTGYSEKITQAMIQHLGVQALIMKPLVRREMALAVRQALESKRPEQP
jgi:PAS domain S-box-containing protein